MPTVTFPHPPSRPHPTPEDPKGRKHTRLKTNRLPGDWDWRGTGRQQQGQQKQHRKPSESSTYTYSQHEERTNYRPKNGINASLTLGDSFSGGMRGVGMTGGSSEASSSLFSRRALPALCLAVSLPLVVLKSLGVQWRWKVVLRECEWSGAVLCYFVLWCVKLCCAVFWVLCKISKWLWLSFVCLFITFIYWNISYLLVYLLIFYFIQWSEKKSRRLKIHIRGIYQDPFFFNVSV